MRSVVSTLAALRRPVRHIESWHELTAATSTFTVLLSLLLSGSALLRPRLLPIAPHGLLHLRLHEDVRALVAADLQIRLVVSVGLIIFDLLRGSTMYRILPTLIELRVLTPNGVVQHGRLLDCLKSAPRMLPMNILVSTRAAHLDHIHDILRVWVLLLTQVEHFEFLAHG